MRYQGNTDFRHDQPLFCGVLMVNLGTPEAATTAAVRRYLAEFLADPRVVELPRLPWLALLHGIILPLRAPRSARAYASIWGAEGSPLRSHSQALIDAVGRDFVDDGVTVGLAMRYGEPSIATVLRDWRERGLRRLLVLPLYPQYSATTTASVFDAVTAELRQWRWLPELRWIGDYHAEPGWIAAIAATIRGHWSRSGPADRLLFSFHGLPQSSLRAGDPYFCQCHASARRIAEALGLAPTQWQLGFQSRVGRQTWLQPYTEPLLGEWARNGVKTVDVVCPGFAVDCLETLEEIAIRARAHFLAAGGEDLRYVPALNASPTHAQFLAELARRHLAGWATQDSECPQRDRQFQQYQGPQR